MAAVRPAQPLPIMTTLYIQTLPQYWIRRAGSVVQRGGYCIVPLVQQPNWIGFLQRAPGLRLTQKNAALIFRLTHRNAWLAGNKEKDNMDPRYPVGNYTPPQEVTPALRQQAIAAIAEAPANLRAAVKGLSEAQLDTPY